MSMGDKSNIIDEVKTFLFTICSDELRRTYWERTLSIQRWAFYCKVWDASLNDITVPWRWMSIYTLRVCFNGRQVYDRLTILMGVGTVRTINQRTILDRIQEINDLLSFLMTNQATPHLGALSSLINSESSNHRGQPKMGSAFTAERMANTWMSQCIERIKKALECKQRHPMTMEHQRGGTYISKTGKMHCISSNFKSIAYLFCRYFTKQNSQRDPTRLRWNKNSSKSHQIWQFHKRKIHKWRQERWIFIHEKRFTSTNVKQCEDD